MIGLNSLYNTPAGNGLCAGTAPKLMFADNIGPGVIKLIHRALTGRHEGGLQREQWRELLLSRPQALRPGTGNGTSAAAAAPEAPGAASNTAVDVKLPLTGGTSTAPYIDYDADVGYVTTADDVVHKFLGVFTGTPSEVTAAGTGWRFLPALESGTVHAGLRRRLAARLLHRHVGGRHRLRGRIGRSGCPARKNKFLFAPGLAVAAPVMIESHSTRRCMRSPSNPNGVNRGGRAGHT